MARGPRFVFFGGKGGVGKTTCAAAAASRAAAEGERVLVVSTDPAHSLADALDAKLGPEPRRVNGADGVLFACELDADKALSLWLRQREEAIRTIANRGTYFDEEDIDRFFSLSLPGVDELVGLIELVRLSRARPFDVVVVDTAPTGHTLRLLEMPSTLLRLSEVLDDMHAKHRFLASSLGGAWRGDFADDAIAEIEREAKKLRKILRDPGRATFTWVSLPEEMSVRETEDGVRELEALGVTVDVVVVNRVSPTTEHPCASCALRAKAEAEWRGWFARHYENRTVVEIPIQSEEPRGPGALGALAASVRHAIARQEPPRRPAANAPAPSVEPVSAFVPDTARLVFVGGKGGVGKTTLGAALALELALTRPRQRVLCVSIDPAHSLGDALGIAIGDEAKAVAGAPANLEFRELDAARAWEVERKRHRRAIDELFASFLRGSLDIGFDRAVLEDLVDLAPPGLDELLALITLLDALLDGDDAVGESKRRREVTRYDLVVVDTAPTGHTLRLLELPQSALEWVHALMSIVLKYRSVVGLGEFASDLTRFARKLRALIELLHDPARCAFVVATRPARLPALETERLVKALRGLNVPVTAIVANAVTVPSCARCEKVARAERPAIERLGRLASRSARLARLVTVPALYPGPRGAAELLAFRRTWTVGP